MINPFEPSSESLHFLQGLKRARQEIALRSPEVFAAAHTVTEIAEHYHGPDLLDMMLQFFVDYDHFRTKQVEDLKRDLTEALRWSAKPITLPRQ